MKTRILFIINPKSGVAKKKNLPELINTYLDDSKFDAEIKFTQYSGHGYKLAREAVQLGFDIVCAVGGDGSVHNVGMALIGTDTALAVIPTGSGNGYARHFDIPTRIPQAILTLNQQKIRKVDVGTINNKHFLGVAGFGFDGHIAWKFAKRKSRGLWGYVQLVLKEYFSYPSKEFTVEFNNGKKISEKTFMISVSNATEFGNGFCISPFSDVQDGKLELVLLKKPTLFQAPFIVSKFFKGRAQNSKLVRTYRFDSLILTTKSEKFHADGEPITLSSTIHVGVKPKALHVIAGENFA